MEKSSFFNSVNGDRKYKAEDFADYFSKFITNGVFPNIASNLQVIANGTDMTVTLKAGAAWINGYMYQNTDDLILPIDVADGVLNRIDRVVIQLNYAERLIKAVVKKGTFSSSPVAPSLQRDADIYEIGIADIAVNKGVTSITQSAITDLRLNTTLCGMVNSLLQADTTAIFEQYQDWFERETSENEQEFDQFMADQQQAFQTWFDSVKGQLSGDVAGSLANRITEVETDLAAHSADYVKHPGYAVATGSANAYSVALNPAPTSYVEGMAVSVKINVDNTGPSTININGLGAVPIKKPNGNDVSAGNLKAGSIYTLRYNGTNFILQGEGGEYGTAGAPQVLEGYTVGTENGVIPGTMPNNGAITITPTTTDQTIPAGYHNGSGKVKGDPNLIPSNILSGKSIFGVTGNVVQGKRWGSGTNSTDGSGHLIISLPFKPRLIFLHKEGYSIDSRFLYYYELLSTTDYVYRDKTGALMIRAISYDGGYVNPSGFNFYVEENYTNFQWIAYE
ncbi:hypothetical protein [Bacillus smithii]|uniref:hypothetical protein n=1 Tax=Bacillus smithii TaxID=1479 RepID=UPI002E23C4B5|nr:hypothetical protein [Bacillus smithii]MED1456663.1 hypothetical protein [Bacillus smithii]